MTTWERRPPSFLGRAGCVVAMATALIAAGQTDAETLKLRDGSASPINATIQQIDDSGVTYATDGKSMFLTWDRVEAIDGKTLPGLQKYLELGEILWRARTRLERDDTDSAEPLLVSVVAKISGQTHATALVAWEGLLRCRIARGEQAGAVIPALETSRILRRIEGASAYPSLEPIVDGGRLGTWLCPKLAPFFLVDERLNRLISDLDDYKSGDDAFIAAMASEYRRAALVALGKSVAESSSRTKEGDGPGVRLLSQTIDCLVGDAAAREGARNRLQQKLSEYPSWGRSWARFAIGWSLCREEGVVRKQRGVVSLLHLPAVYATQEPWLSALALHESAKTLDVVGDSTGAATLRDDLRRMFPSSPLASGASLGAEAAR